MITRMMKTLLLCRKGLWLGYYLDQQFGVDHLTTITTSISVTITSISIMESAFLSLPATTPSSPHHHLHYFHQHLYHYPNYRHHHHCVHHHLYRHVRNQISNVKLAGTFQNAKIHCHREQL